MLKVANSVISASRITGVLPVVNGGTGVTTSTGTGNTVLSAAPTLSGDVTLSTGNLVIGTSGKGIDFSVTTSGSGTMTSELLADYEEGTWTPVVTAAVGTITTVGAVSGTYTKIGRQVTLGFKIAITTNGTGSNSILIAGIPFSPPAVNLYAGVAYESIALGTLNSVYWSSVTELRMANYAGLYPATNGSTFTGTITYFV